MSQTEKPIAEVLVPVDFSGCSLNALEFAKRIVASTGARLHLLYVDDDPLLMQPTTAQQVREEHEAKMAAKFDDCLTPEERERYRAVTAIRSGTAYHEIEKYAGEEQIDIIAVGRVGRSGLADALLGSVAKHVIRNAPCPVVAVRQEHVSRDDSANC